MNASTETIWTVIESNHSGYLCRDGLITMTLEAGDVGFWLDVRHHGMDEACERLLKNRIAMKRSCPDLNYGIVGENNPDWRAEHLGTRFG